MLAPRSGELAVGFHVATVVPFIDRHTILLRSPVTLRKAMPIEAPSSPAESASTGAIAIRSAPQRFLESWVDAVLGFLICVVLPIPLYATGEPFKARFGGTEQTILATAIAYGIVWYCGRRLDAFPKVTLQGNL